MTDAALKKKLKQIIVKATGISLSPDQIGDNTPLTKLGIDSMAALEVVVALETEFGVSITDMETGIQAFSTINSLANFVEKNRS